MMLTDQLAYLRRDSGSLKAHLRHNEFMVSFISMYRYNMTCHEELPEGPTTPVSGISTHVCVEPMNIPVHVIPYGIYAIADRHDGHHPSSITARDCNVSSPTRTHSCSIEAHLAPSAVCSLQLPRCVYGGPPQQAYREC